MPGLTIGVLARRAGVGVETVRFYERQGLIAPPPRSASGYRCYSEETVRRLRFIRRAKRLGFSLREIRELLELRERPEATCADVRKRAESKLADIEQRIRELEEIRQALATLVAGCGDGVSLGECPILRNIDLGE